MMLTQLYASPGWGGPGPWHDGGPGWWIVFPILFWVIVLSMIGYVIYRRTPRQVARVSGEQALAERYARGEIDEEEYERRRSVLRGGSASRR